VIKMAMEADAFVKKKYAEDKKAFEQSYDGKIVGVLELDGKVRPNIFSSAEELKLVTGRKDYPNLVYAGKIKLKDGEYNSLEEVDMSKVKLHEIVLTEKGKKLVEERRKEMEERTKKLKSYSNQMPDEIKSMIKGIDSETSYAIMVCLSKDGDQTHNQLKERLGLGEGTLREGIKRLQYGALVNEWAPIYFLKDKESNETKGVKVGPVEESTYGITMLGSHFLMGLGRTFELPTRKESREWQLREYERLGISPQQVKIQKMKRTKELKPKALEVLKQNPDIKPKELKEIIGADLQDFDRVTRRIKYEWKLSDL
jgi:hypothetical protein